MLTTPSPATRNTLLRRIDTYKAWSILRVVPLSMKEQTALTALRDELRKIFEPCGARVEEFDVQMGGRSMRWRSRTPDYPSHHVGGGFEEWTIAARPDPQHRITVVIVRDENLLDPRNESHHSDLFESRWMPERLRQGQVSAILNALGIELHDPIITVLPVTTVWNSR